MVIDRYGRPLSNFRISVTERCNLNCFYCHREGAIGNHGEMAIEEFYPILEEASALGMRKLKITGGEPLVKKELPRLIAFAKPLFKEISLTTNGVLLADRAAELKEAGLDRVNVSLDTLDGALYEKITRAAARSGKSYFDRVLDGIDAATAFGLNPVKINMVVMKDLNVDEIPAMIDFCTDRGVILQLIEMLTLNGAFYSLDTVEKELEARALAIEENDYHRRKRYHLDGAGKSMVEVVRPMDNTIFCANCKRLRLTADGYLKPCLMRNDNLVRARGLGGEALTAAFAQAIEAREPYYKEAKERYTCSEEILQSAVQLIPQKIIQQKKS